MPKWLTLLLSRRARRAVRGLGLLRRAYEHVLVAAVLEVPERRCSYMDALGIIAGKAELIARQL